MIVVIFKQEIEVRWSDIDANHHVTHTAYATFATHARIEWMASIGYSMGRCLEAGFGAIVLKEETEYFREIFLGERVGVELFYSGSSVDYAFWKFTHKICKMNNKLSARHIVYGAWINSVTRKIAPPPQDVVNILSKLPHGDNFEIIEKTAKN